MAIDRRLSDASAAGHGFDGKGAITDLAKLIECSTQYDVP
jgi:hypothetical protein